MDPSLATVVLTLDFLVMSSPVNDLVAAQAVGATVAAAREQATFDDTVCHPPSVWTVSIPMVMAISVVVAAPVVGVDLPVARPVTSESNGTIGKSGPARIAANVRKSSSTGVMRMA